LNVSSFLDGLPPPHTGYQRQKKERNILSFQVPQCSKVFAPKQTFSPKRCQKKSPTITEV